jgi:Ca2+-binding EF-hand superfamily protein
VPEPILRLKKRIYMEINNAFKQSGKTLRSLFSAVDVDQSNEIELDEFRAMYDKMGLKLTP